MKGLVVYDLRYMVVDDSIVLFGLPEKFGREQPTRRGFTIMSESLATMLRERFYRT